MSNCELLEGVDYKSTPFTLYDGSYKGTVITFASEKGIAEHWSEYVKIIKKIEEKTEPK